ncbi:phosphopantetheine-binding protein [Streptomyces sp. NPDC059134]|uniref:phosphopantetheine-binding protein n=1 Tax=Streptomyces sp. NPDC059134 TaxID=3346738 RepID=UPI0036856229
MTEPPVTATERVLAAIWSEVLEVSQVSVEDNFFDLGGHSVLLHMVQDRIGRELGKNPPLVELFTYPTVRALARRLAGGARAGAGGSSGAGRAAGGARPRLHGGRVRRTRPVPDERGGPRE